MKEKQKHHTIFTIIFKYRRDFDESKHKVYTLLRIEVNAFYITEHFTLILIIKSHNFKRYLNNTIQPTFNSNITAPLYHIAL